MRGVSLDTETERVNTGFIIRQIFISPEDRDSIFLRNVGVIYESTRHCNPEEQHRNFMKQISEQMHVHYVCPYVCVYACMYGHVADE